MKNEKAITLRLPEDLLDKADALVPHIADHGEFRAMRITRSTVLRMALLKGLEALEEKHHRDLHDTLTGELRSR